MKRIAAICAVSLLVLLVAGCAAGPNSLTGTNTGEGKVAGFPLGLWHGIIAPVTFVISLFSDKVSLYEVHNNGGWYDFGFVLGMMIIFGGGSGGAAKRRR